MHQNIETALMKTQSIQNLRLGRRFTFQQYNNLPSQYIF